MRWRSCSRLLVALACVACVTTTTRYYIPSAGEPRLTTAELRERASGMLHVRCPHLLGTRDSVQGTAVFRLVADSSGLVQRAYLERGPRGEAFMDILGALAAQLDLRGSAGTTPAAADPLYHLVVLYSCTRSASALRLQVDSTRQ